MTGTTLGHYRVLRKLGEGGMGEIYEAEDTRLHRKVALKTLPGTVASDPERRQRFEREAQAVAALNHPNIVTIHSVEESPPAGPGQPSVPFLTMELVEGTTLSDLIPTGGMPLGRLLKIGVAVADAISAAQQKGITHRDLKPGNVMVTPGGQVKVLDFGLAKLRDLEAEASSQAATMLATGGLTGEGRILGTVAYMSPEQAQAKPVDTRSDIFSLGVILHQMATGEQPFTGDTPVSVISSILKDTPSSVTDLKPGLPSDLARIVRRCLAKDPERRYQTAADLRNDLEELKQTIDSGVTSAGAISRVAAPLKARSLAWIGVGAIVVAAGAVLVWMSFARARGPESRMASPAAAVSFDAVKMSRLTSTGKATLGAISSDGKFVVHVVAEPDGPSLWVRQTATPSNVRIVAPARVRYNGITVSPDGTYVYYVTYAGGSGIASLFQIPVLGGTPRKVIEDIDSPPSFSPDGSRFVFVRGLPDLPGAAVLIANVDGTGERQLAVRKFPILFNQVRPAWSPDGKTIAVSGQTVSGTLPQHVVLLDAESGTERVLGDEWYSLGSLAWATDGSALVASAVERGGLNRQLFRIAYPGGDVTRITNDLANYDGVSLSADSRLLVTIQSETLSTLWVMPASDPAGATALTSGPRRDDGRAGLAWTPDGRIVYGSSTDGTPQIWIMDADGSDQRQLTTDALNAYPAVCADGRYVVYMSVRSGAPQVWRMDLDGAGPIALAKDMPSFQPMCAPDAASAVFNAVAAGGRQAVWRVAIEGGQPEKVAEHQFAARAVSPDGTLVAGPAYDNERRRQCIGILDLRNPASLNLLPFAPRAMSWMPSGLMLGYVDAKDEVDNVWAVPAAGGAPKQVTRFTDQSIFAFAWSRDGKQLALSRGTVSTDVVLLSVR